MQVHKFGGASISTAERIRKIPGIIDRFECDQNIIVISALGKVTNALENVVNQAFEGNLDAGLGALEEIRKLHVDLMTSLLQKQLNACSLRLNDLFAQARRALEETAADNYNFFYDQIVPFGELFSTTLVSHFLLENGVANKWVDARQILLTNANFREAGILWDESANQCRRLLKPLLATNNQIITQGFIGATSDGWNTTLGREGSDYTAATLAYIMDAEKVTIWKDVPGVMNGDPRQFLEVRVIPHLSYKEVIEMAYYGAQVIHPKTIKPLQNKSVNLYVKCFLDPALPGTVIDGKDSVSLPPVLVIKPAQILLTFQTRDFSFIEGGPTSRLNAIIEGARVKANLSQNTAISLLVCIDDIPDKVHAILADAGDFEVSRRAGLTLLTIRHYNEAIIEKMTAGKTVILQQKTQDTLQLLY